MTAMRAARRGGALSTLLTGLVLAGLIVGAGAWYAGRRISAAIEAQLRQGYFADPSRGTFESAGVDWLGPRLFVRGIRLEGLRGDGWTGRASVREASAAVPWRGLTSGKVSVKQVAVDDPLVEIVYSSAATAAPSGSAPLLAGALAQLPIEAVEVSRGGLRLTGPDGKSLSLTRVAADARRAEGGSAAASIHAEGRLENDPTALLRLEIRLRPTPGDFDGEVHLEELPIPILAALLPTDPDVKYESGRLTINSSFNCKSDWLTASHLVELKQLKVTLAPSRKELFGIATKYLTDLLDIDHLSFVVPMNGALSDPHISVSSSVEEIMLKILDAKFKGDHDRAAKWAHWGGQHFGGKMDRALRDWMRARRKA